MKPEISVIIVSYNTEKYLRACLSSLRIQSGDIQTEVIIFDNHSQDGTIELVRREYPLVKLIAHSENLGFAKANNEAAKQATGKYLLFINPDTKLDPDCLKILLSAAKDQASQDFLLIPKQVTYETGDFLCLGLAADIFGYSNTAYATDGAKQIRPIFYADGAAFFLPRETFLKLGLFDEGFFMYQEDIDLSWKAHLMKMKLIPIPDAIVSHKVGAVAGGGLAKGRSYETNFFRRQQAERNLLCNLLKNYSGVNLLWILPLYLIFNFGEFVLFLLLLKPKTSTIYLKSYWWNVANLRQTLAKRSWIQKRREVPDREILAKMVKIPSKLFLLFRVGIPTVKG